MRWWPLVGALVLGTVSTAHADGVCVTIDVSKDNLEERERFAVRVAVQEALAREGVAVDRQGYACRGSVFVYSVKLGKRVTTTIFADGKSVNGSASSLDEVDLLVRQLVRSLVTGKSLATGFGVTDRYNVLRDQTAPRRADPSARRWDPVFAVGGGMLQLPAVDGRPRQRQYNIVSLELRTWGFLDNEQAAFELYGRALIHDYGVFEIADNAYERAKETDDHLDEVGRAGLLLLSPFGTSNWDLGFGFVNFIGLGPPRLFLRAGATMSLLMRFSDPEHRIDFGFGGYVGVGLQLSENVNLSVAANVANPLIHDFADDGYWYFLTTTAMLEFRAKGKPGDRPPSLFEPDPVPTIRRINE